MTNIEQTLKIKARRTQLEHLSREIKSRIRGKMHGKDAWRDQRDLEVSVRPELTACHILIASFRGKIHLSDKTSDLTRSRASKFLEVLST